MTNTNVQSPIPLRGPGFVRKINGGYEPGEMKRLQNVEFLDESIVCRRQILTAINNLGAARPTKFVGESRGKPFLGNAHITTGAIGYSPTANSEAVTLPVSATFAALTGYQVSIEGLVEYRGFDYWIIIETPDAALTDQRVSIYKAAAGTLDLNSATRTVMHTFAATKLAINPGELVGSFMHKERLFLAFQSTIYWSKATDPTVWAAPDGGFAVMDTAQIIDAAAINDSIYVCGYDSIFTLSYSVDIDTELTIRKVNAPFGAHSLVVFQDSVYSVNQNGIFRIQNTNIEKLVDLPTKYPHSFKILAHDAYLYIVCYYSTRLNTLATPGVNEKYLKGRFANTNGVGGLTFTNAPNVLCLNMETGCMSELLLNFPLPADGINFVSDMFVATDLSGNSTLYFITNKPTAYAASIITSSGSVYYSHAGLDRLPYDVGSSSYRMPINIEFDSFCPDGNEHLMKKFRSLLVEGTFPGGTSDSLKCAIAYDNRAYKTPTNLEDATVSTARPPYPHRTPLNQRGRSISINLYNGDLSTVLSGANPATEQKFEIDDVRLLWSYTQRVSEMAEQSKTA